MTPFQGVVLALILSRALPAAATFEDECKAAIAASPPDATYFHKCRYQIYNGSYYMIYGDTWLKSSDTRYGTSLLYSKMCTTPGCPNFLDGRVIFRDWCPSGTAWDSGAWSCQVVAPPPSVPFWQDWAVNVVLAFLLGYGLGSVARVLRAFTEKAFTR